MKIPQEQIAPLQKPLETALGVYLHIPYCRLVCPYCDFVKKGARGGIPEEFVDALCREIDAYEGPRAAESIFFGGGTPSMLAALQLERILARLHAAFAFDAPEVSLETNPDDVTEASVRAWRSLGVTRLSLGVQSFDDEALRYLGRIHDARHAREACERVASAFDVWGMDLIFGAGSAAGWAASLAECVRFDPPHVSTYGLTYEQNTPFWRKRHEAMDDDASLALYREAMAVLGAYEHYEVSNFAKAGYECRHNRIYWRNEAYVGFGPGAYSFLGGVRMRNQSNITAYIREPLKREERLSLSEREQKIETLIQHFRTRTGLRRGYYRNRFGSEIEAEFGGTMEGLIARVLIACDGERYWPTTLGYELNDEIGLALV